MSTGLWLGVGMTPAPPLSGIVTGIATSLLIAPAVELHRVHASRNKGVPASPRAFAGIYGTVHRFDSEAFRFAIETDGHPGIGHWLFMAFYVATSQGLVDIVPQSGTAKLAVGVQLTACLSWAVVVFAAVMTRMHPVLQRISERSA